MNIFTPKKAIIAVLLFTIAVLLWSHFSQVFWEEYTGGWAPEGGVSLQCGWNLASRAYNGAALDTNSFTSVEDGKMKALLNPEITGFAWYNNANRPTCMFTGVFTEAGKKTNRTDVTTYVKRHGILGKWFGF